MSERQGEAKGDRLLCCALLMALLGCGDGTLRSEEGRFELSATSLDFGAALRGETTTLRSLEVRNVGRTRRTISLRTDPPFSGPASLELGGGEVRTVELSFLAGAGLATGRLTATDGDASLEVALAGEGVVPLDCVPSSPCHESSFDLATRTCLETVRADGSSCIPTSLCLDAGTCVAGACVGQPRQCDDENACTDDACAEAVGCVHTTRVCPPSSRACHVAVCDPDQGCGEAPAQNLTPCGAISCESASLCMAGQCQAFAPAPDGMPCGLETPCRDEATCREGTCEIPEPTELTPVWSLPLAGELVGPVRGLAPNVYVQTCDAAAGCALTSFTGIDTGGFSRWTTPLSEERVLLGLDAAGVCTEAGRAVVTLDPATGGQTTTLLADLDAVLPAGAYALVDAGSEGRIALGADGARHLLTYAKRVVDVDAGADDAGTDDAGTGEPDGGGNDLPDGDLEVLQTFAADGGPGSHRIFAAAGREAALALGADGTAWVYSAEGRLTRVATDDAGTVTTDAFDTDPGFAQLAVTGERLVVGGRTLLDLAGGRVSSLALPDAGVALVEHTPPWVLLDAQAAYVLARPCADDGAGGCLEKPSLSAYLTGDGAQAWSVALDDDGMARTPVEAALLGVATQPITGVGVLYAEVEGTSPAGWVRLYTEGVQFEACRLPGVATVRGGLFQGDALYAVVERDGVLRLEAYRMTPLLSKGSGWPQRDGISGARRER